MVRTRQKRKVKIKNTKMRSAKNDSKHKELINDSVQSKDHERKLVEIENDGKTTETPSFSNENAKYPCTICNQLFKYKTGLKKHQSRHQPPGGFICPECGERFVTDAERLLHKENIHKIFKCMVCNEKSNSETEFVEHINRLHNGRDREFVICDDCGAQFRQKNQLRLHCKSRCGTIRCYTCNQCDAKFMTQNTLNAHLLIHKGEKKHLCDFCGNSFLSRGQLKIHERCHTKEKPYKCLVCNKGFAHRESLVTHSSLHTGVKPWLCQCCGQKFSCIGNLIKHRRIRPQSCGLPKYENAKCAPRASTKVPGSLTLKKEPVTKWDHSKRKVVEVPELLSERAKLTKRSIESETEPLQIYLESDEIEQVATQMQPLLKDALVESEPETTTELVEVVEQKIISSPLRNALSYTIPRTSVLVVTTDGNYVITKLEDDVNRTNDIQFSPPHVNEIIILDGKDLQLTNMGVNYQTIQQTVNYNTRKIEMLHEAAIATTSPSVEHVKEEEEEEDPMYNLAEPQYAENVSQHLEIVPAGGEGNKEDERIESLNNAGDINGFKCNVCPKRFIQEKSLIKHMDTKHNIECDFVKDKFKCTYCNKQYSKKNLLDKHLQCHGETGELRIKCSCCTKYFDTKFKMQEHARSEHEDRLKCDYCSKIFKKVDCKTAHIRNVHMKIATKKYTFVCSKCGKKFNSHRMFADHENADCGQSPIYKCDYANCGKSLHSLGSLKIHRLIHSGDLPFSCSFCKKQFRTQGQVKVHERSHSGEKPFSCTEPNCSKAFAHRESLLTHLTLHTGIKRFACQGCGSRFSCISNLQAHRRTHQNTCGQLPLDTRAQYTFNLDDGSIMVPQPS